MQVQSTGAGVSAQPQGASSATGVGGNVLGKDSFLQLLVTQMRNQDPLSPMDNQAFLAQLAQFSSLEQMQNLNQKFDASMALTMSLNNSAAAGLIGRNVRASGNEIRLQGSDAGQLGYFLPQAAETVSITIYDSKGTAVRTLVSSEGATGAHHLSWDGRDDDGARLAEGSYTFKITAVDNAGVSMPVSSLVNGKVEGVTYRQGSAYLLIDGREVPLSDVLEISADGTSAQGK